MFTQPEINETIRMIRKENLDIRTITLGINLRDCVSPGTEAANRKIYDKVCRKAERLIPVAEELELEFGIPIINKRVSVTPVSLIAEASDAESYLPFAQSLDRAAETVGIDFLGGFSALVQKGVTEGDRRLIESIPRSLTETGRVCSSVNVASTRAGINMDAIQRMGRIITQTSQIDPQGCAKLVVFSNAPEDNPFMAGAFHGVGEGDCAINVGVSGPGVIKAAIEDIRGDSFDQLAETIKQTAFKITRMGRLVAREAAARLGYNFGIVDLSLAPTPSIGDSVARILEEMGLETAGAPGSTAAVALLNDAVKKGGIMASSHVGGLSGAFLPVSEDEGMAEAVRKGSLSLAKLEAMTAVCSVGLDMVAVPGDTTAQTISAIIADEISIGVVNKKTTAVRIIPVPGKTAGEWVEFGGLLGRAPVMEVSRDSSSDFIARGGRIPAPLTSYVN